ncbi:hypothetical protein MCUN1_001394 [Malassezia cuniculi]|uniref:Uncharacterized protein n=1 Tax=Malassezia cuniculi TaxID=948313 RepID=A0AAF0EXQ8_9BASI|nr:hypothetical protein MCUN1_001394 [Malassezia cuniculi]
MRLPRHPVARLGPRVFSRGYAVPLNPSTSFDPVLGTTVPPPPPTVDPSFRRKSPRNQQPGRSPIERFAIAAANELVRGRTHTSSSLGSLLESLDARSGHQLSIELPYESTPKPGRRVPLTSALSPPSEISHAIDDGVVLLCFVDNVGSGAERINMCTGFAIHGGEAVCGKESESRGPLIVSCSHTLQSLTDKINGRGVALAISRLGHVYPISSLLSSLPMADLSLFQLAETPVPVGTSGSRPPAPLRTLPVSPYPAVVDSELCVSSFSGWQPRGAAALGPSLTDDSVVRSRWGRAKLVGYKDAIGRVAYTGTYDDLFQMDFALRADAPENHKSLLERDARGITPEFPIPGSSGGPVVDVQTGSVVGIVRGYRTNLIHGSRGDAVPSEKVYECTCLLTISF